MGPPLLLLTTGLLVILQFAIPKRWAFAPLLVAALHLGDVEILPELTPVRIVCLVGLIRAMAMGTLKIAPKCTLDKVLYAFSITALVVSIAPRLDVPSPLNQNLGLILNLHGTYLYGRSLINGEDILERFSKAFVYTILPLCLFLYLEVQTGKNYYYPLGARSPYGMMRGDEQRAVGPFQHAILSGTVCAAAIPFALFIYREKRLLGGLAMAGCILGVLGSNSSGPMAAAMFAGICLLGWKVRRHLSKIERYGLLSILFLHIISTRGVWYLMARIDLAGGSTGYHRAKLIDNALGDLDRWWLFGTDYTRTWMFSGVSWSDRHTDITNYYLQIGVIGGLPLMICFILILVKAFKDFGKGFRRTDFASTRDNFGRWCACSALMAHTLSFFSIAYFDQSFAHLMLLVALAPAAAAITDADPEDPQRHAEKQT